MCRLLRGSGIQELGLSSLRQRGTPATIIYTGQFRLSYAMADQLQDWVARIRKGEVRALARAITAIENREPESVELLKAVFPHSGKAQVIGLTGAPGAGKSTLVDQLAREYRNQAKTVGIIAVDPTSPYTGGGVLGGGPPPPTPHPPSGAFILPNATPRPSGG